MRPLLKKLNKGRALLQSLLITINVCMANKLKGGTAAFVAKSEYKQYVVSMFYVIIRGDYVTLPLNEKRFSLFEILPKAKNDQCTIHNYVHAKKRLNFSLWLNTTW